MVQQALNLWHETIADLVRQVQDVMPACSVTDATEQKRGLLPPVSFFELPADVGEGANSTVVKIFDFCRLAFLL